MDSTRLPGKAMREIAGVTAIERVIESLGPSKYLNEIVITTTTEPEDNALETLAREKNLLIYRGDRDNLVKRFLEAGEKFNSDLILRVTGDCPAVSYEIADILIASHIDRSADYTAAETERLPVGVCSEVISFSALKKLNGLNLNFKLSEYLTYYFMNNPGLFSVNVVSAPKEYQFPQYRLTLDYQEDLDMFNRLFYKLKENKLVFSLKNVLSLLNEYPDIAKFNSHLTLKYKTDSELIAKIKEATTIKTSSCI